ncbi:AsmA family protein [Pseudazoarcus pumilus]|nr:AsmA family protein [Pseudazoarcus pumilus]
MKTAFRIVAIVLAVVVVLFGVVAAYLAFVFDPNDYRDRIESEVEKRTGRSLAIEGELSLSVFPWIGVEIGPTQLGNATGFGDAPFARVEQVEVRARLMPLLRQEVEVDRVVLRGLDLNLVRNADGSTNWDDLAARGKGESPEEAPPSSPGEAMGGLGAIVVAGVEIADARVRFDDRQAGAEYAIDGFMLKTGEVRPRERFPLEMGFDVAVSEPEVAGRVDLSGAVLFDPVGPKLDVDGLELRFKGEGAGLPGGEAEFAADADASVDMAAGTAALDGLVLRSYGVEARGDLAGNGLNESPSFAGRFEVPEFDPRKLLAAMDVALPEGVGGDVLKKASLSTNINATASSARLGDLVAVLDDSRLSGEMSVADFAKQALRFELALDAIDVDRYLPPPEDGEATPREVSGPREGAPADAGAEAAVAILDPAVLRGLDVVGKFTAGRIKARGLTINDISVEVKAQGGVLRLEPLAAKMYEGSYAGSASFDGRAQTLSMVLANRLSGVQAGPLLADLSGAEQRLTGNANVESRLQARGNDTDAIKRTLAGNVDFRFLDGAIKGINVAQFLRQAQAKLTGKPAPAGDGPNQTDFTELSGTVRISDGVARNDDLDLRSPLLRVVGEGSANLPDETVDYLVRASVVASLSGQGGEGLEQLKGVTVPIRISGNLDDPSIRPDLESLVTDRVKQEAQKKLEEAVQDKVAPELQEGLKKGLGDFLQRR